MSSLNTSLSMTDTRPRLPLLILFAASFWMALALVCGLSSVNPAMGQSVKSELRNGNAGEGYDGFLIARKPSATNLVNSVNAKRRKVYEKRAKELNQSVSVVGEVYAKELYNRARSGTWFYLKNRTWVQKP